MKKLKLQFFKMIFQGIMCMCAMITRNFAQRLGNGNKACCDFIRSASLDMLGKFLHGLQSAVYGNKCIFQIDFFGFLRIDFFFFC